MQIEIRTDSVADLAEYASVPIAFEVRRVLAIKGAVGPGGGVELEERLLEIQFIKDYDTLDGGPREWHRRFDLSSWGLFSARVKGRRVGGAAIAPEPADSNDTAILWDLRVVVVWFIFSVLWGWH